MDTKEAFSEPDDDYIDMDLSSSPNLFSYTSIGSPPQTREFEFQFQMAPFSHDKESPADELFYKGKLLPLHLPPRLQMVQKMLHNPNTEETAETEKAEAIPEHKLGFPFTSRTNLSTHLESCNLSPPESRRVSSEMNADECLFEWSNTEMRGFLCDLPNMSWSMKMKQIKLFPLSQKLKASRAYLKSLFRKSGCSDGSCANTTCNVRLEQEPKGKFWMNKHKKMMKNVSRSEIVGDGGNLHRRSFSGVIQRHSPAKSSSLSTSSSNSSSASSSFSFSSNGFCDLHLLKRSESASSEFEGSIHGAIAHCRQSQQMYSSIKTLNELGVCSLSASRSAANRKTC